MLLSHRLTELTKSTTAAIIICCSTTTARALEAPPDDATTGRTAREAKVEAPTEKFNVTFAPGEGASGLAPNFSPKGTQFGLMPQDVPNLGGLKHLVGKIELGPREAMPNGIKIAFAKSQPDQPYDQLFADTNLNGDLADETPVAAVPKLTRDKWWSSFDGITLKVRHSDRPEHTIDYPVAFWITVESPDEQPPLARFTRRGFLQGSFQKSGRTYHVVLTDRNNDALFERGDSWGIALADDEGGIERPVWRTIDDFSWGGDVAWKLTLNAADGGGGVVTVFDPEVSRADDEAMRDHLRADKLAPRAEKPLAFEKEFETAIKLATESGKPCFVKFETDWCGPCKAMHQFVFTAKDVVDAADGVVCVTVDGDKRKDLKERFEVGGYPTGIFLDANQKETARFSGYRSVKEMREAFSRLAR
ncbi:MAG: hypothetical protein C0478_05740 [Planctomyces sp.]|nr:hypothetical protein [Planctomyces sp.]